MADRMNYTMLLDFYELTMAQGYFLSGQKDKIAYFDVFFRDIPDGGGFAIAAGLQDIIDYIKNLKFTEEDIAYLRGKGLFTEEFLAYLATDADHLLLSETKREAFFNEIRKTMTRYGGKITMYDTVDLQIARKP